MLGRVLGQNTMIHTFGELHFFENMVDAKTIRERPIWSSDQGMQLLERLLTSAREGFFAKLQLGKFTTEAKSIMAKSSVWDPVSLYEVFLKFETQRVGKSIPCEQTPRYLFFVNEILAAFPDARIINLVRDPRDVLLSQKNKWKRRYLGASGIPRREAIRSWANYHPIIISKLWASCMRQGNEIGKSPRVKTVRFEDLVMQPENTVQELCNFLEISFEKGMLKIPQVGSSSGIDNTEQEGINRKRAHSWNDGNLGSTEISLCEWITKNEMRQHGYLLSGSGKFHVRMLPSMILLILKLSIAIPMNLSRTRNIRETLLRRLNPGKSE